MFIYFFETIEIPLFSFFGRPFIFFYLGIQIFKDCLATQETVQISFGTVVKLLLLLL